MDINLHNSWQNFIEIERKKDYFKKLELLIDQAYTIDEDKIFPAKNELFKALEYCPVETVKVVIIGQDPYPTKGHANGLCFSVNNSVQPLPKSLKNIFLELENDLGVPFPVNGNLERWARQGVLLLNSVLSVEEGKPGSHAKFGWEIFTSSLIEFLGENREGVVYLLWGSKAQEKANSIDASVNCVLKSVHPSPLSSYRGFFGSKHFSKANNYLESIGKKSISW